MAHGHQQHRALRHSLFGGTLKAEAGLEGGGDGGTCSGHLASAQEKGLNCIHMRVVAFGCEERATQCQKASA